jgi:hypothetical protein
MPPLRLDFGDCDWPVLGELSVRSCGDPHRIESAVMIDIRQADVKRTPSRAVMAGRGESSVASIEENDDTAHLPAVTPVESFPPALSLDSAQMRPEVGSALHHGRWW